MKLLDLRLVFLILFFSAGVHASYAQDSVKRAGVTKTPATKLPVKPVYKKPATVITPTASATLPPTRQAAVLPPTDKSLNGQYQYLLTKLYGYQRPLVSALWKNYSDTLNATRRKLKEAQVTVSAQAKTIDTLKSSVNSKEQTLAQSNARVDEVNLLGIPMTKATYNWIMWGLVIGFGVIAAIVIARSGSHSREAKYRIKLYNELEEEYKNYKVKANEKEKKLARELQTERNKLDELRGNA